VLDQIQSNLTDVVPEEIKKDIADAIDALRVANAEGRSLTPTYS
jgi:hypothetical protein